MCPTEPLGRRTSSGGGDGGPPPPPDDAGHPDETGPPESPDDGTKAGGRPEGERARRHRADLQGAVSGKAARKLKARREGDRGIWFGLGMMGLVGWSVTVPTVVGVAVGVWLDRRSVDPAGVSWTLTGLIVGVLIGCINAWVWIQRELDGG
jgi:ATP synthase protein I